MIATLLRVPPLPCVEHLLSRPPSAEIKEKLEEAKSNLMERGLLKSEPDGSVALDGALVAVVQAAVLAARTVRVYLEKEGEEPRHRLVHLASALVVEQDPQEHGQVAFTAVRDLDVLRERLTEFLSFPESQRAPGQEVVLSDDDLVEARRFAVDPDSCVSFLRQCGLADESVGPLAEALVGPQHLGSVAVFGREPADMGEAHGLALERNVSWLIGPQGAWRVLPTKEGNRRSARLVPASGRDIERDLAELIDSLR